MPGAATAPLDQILGLSNRHMTYRRTYTKPPVGVFPFRFCLLDEPATGGLPDTPQAVARPSLLRSEIALGLSHQHLTPIAHSHHTLALRRPHRHYSVVCVFVCVTYVLSTLNLFHTIPIVDYICLSDPFIISAIRQLQCIPCYTPTTIHLHVRLL